MQAYKIVDTIQVDGAAENYISLDASFLRFINRTYGRHDILQISAPDVVKKYNLKGIVFGNYVTQEERYHFVFKISKQLEVIAKIAGTNNLGKSKLIIAFGSQGMPRANAHYNPQKQLINLNRGRKSTFKEVLKGENSFIHEYGHFIDFLQGRSDRSISRNFASEAINPLPTNKTTKLYGQIVLNLLKQEKYIAEFSKYPNAKYLTSNVELFARLFESAFTFYVNKSARYRKYAIYFDERIYKNPIFLKKELILKNNLDKRVVEIIKTI